MTSIVSPVIADQRIWECYGFSKAQYFPTQPPIWFVHWPKRTPNNLKSLAHHSGGACVGVYLPEGWTLGLDGVAPDALD